MMNVFSGPISQDEVEEARKMITTTDFDDTTGWEQFLKFDGVTGMRRAVPNKPVYLYKSKSTIDVGYNEFLECYVDLEYRKHWDDTTMEVEVLGQHEGNDVIYWALKYPWPMSARDYTYYRVIKSYPEDKLHLICARSTVLGAHKPEVKGIIRVEEYVSITVIRDGGPGNTEVLCFYYDDPKGSIPKPVVNYATKTGLPKMFATMRTSTKNYKAYKESKGK